MSHHSSTRVLVTRQLPGRALDAVREVADVDVWESDVPPTPGELAERANGCSALVTAVTERVDAALVDQVPTLRHVSNVAVGFDNIDVAACSERGVLVTNTPGVLTDATADLAMALLLAVARRLPEAADAVRTGAWGPWHPTWMCGLELSGAQLGLVGFGAVGRAVARRAEAFGMRVMHHDPTTPGSAPLEEIFERSDIVSLHCPLTPATRGLVDAQRLASMQPHALLINTSRGAVVDSEALVAALHAGTIAGAGLDVTEIEPLPTDHPLLSAPRCLVLPHIGSATLATRTRMADIAITQVIDVLRGEAPAHPVNPEVLDRTRR